MKVTSNLSCLLCISTIAMPVVEASLNGFGLKRSTATKPSLQRQDVFDFAAQQSHRGLKSATAMTLLSKRSAAAKRAATNQKVVEVAVHQERRILQGDLEADAASLAVCELFLVALYGPNSGCTCTDEVPSMECIDFISSNCRLCDTIQSEEACLVSDKEAALAVLPGTGGSVIVDCKTYRSGPFADDTICGVENFSDNTCSFTINEMECNSCTVVACGAETNYDIDCSNIIAGETWNFCFDGIPETSPFIAFGTNGLFQEVTCGDGGVDLGPDSVGLALCQTLVDGDFAVYPGCVCEFDGEDFLPNCDDCVFKSCDTLRGEEACLLVDEDAQFEAEARNGVGGIADCFTYESGPFADSTICLIEDFSDSNTCTITIDGKECNSCVVVTCSDTDGIGVLDESFDLDCSNVMAGETWSLCSDDIPETSPFIAVGNNEFFLDGSCVSADSDEPESDGSIPGDESLGGKDSGDGGDMSGGVAVSSHVLSLVGIIVVTSFW